MGTGEQPELHQPILGRARAEKPSDILEKAFRAAVQFRGIGMREAVNPLIGKQGARADSRGISRRIGQDGLQFLGHLGRGGEPQRLPNQSIPGMVVLRQLL